jgi:hypothetical protein
MSDEPASRSEDKREEAKAEERGGAAGVGN